MDTVALHLASPGPDRRELAAVVRLDGQSHRLVLLAGYDPLAVRARAHALEGVEVRAIDDLDSAARLLVNLAGDAPWIVWDHQAPMDAWRAGDRTGLVGAVAVLDLGELACLALPTADSRSLGALQQAAGLGDWDDPPAGLPSAEAIDRLWHALPGVIAGKPYAVRSTVGELLESAGHALASVWQAAASGPAVAGEAISLEGLLRARLKSLTPAPPEARELGETRPIDPATVAALFEPGGPVASLMPGYERRDGQVSMARAVAETLNDGQLLLVEAETGTGKSLAYLAPAAMFALQNGEPVVITTNTKNLQDQLVSKDIPLLREALRRAGGPWSLGLRAELIKGRGNYLCVERLLREVGEAGLFAGDDDMYFLAYLAAWAAETPTGDLDELAAYLVLRAPRLESLGRRMASEAEFCTAPQMRDHPCFATVARRRAWEAEVLVINHALALANALTPILPPFRHLIVDEAHNLEDIATDAFGLDVSRRGLLSLAREAGASREPRALHNRIRRALAEIGAEADPVLGALTEVEQIAARLGEGIEAFGEQLAGLAMQRLRRSVDDLTQRETMRLDPGAYQGALGEALKAAGDNLRERLAELMAAMGRVVVGLQELHGLRPDGELGKVAGAAHAARGDWTEQVRALDLLLRLDDERYVYWMDCVLRREAWEWQLKAAPIEPGTSLAEHVWTQQASCTLTSATLTVGGQFDYFATRLGLRLNGCRERYRDLKVTSGFDYASQVMLGLPTNISLPQDERFERHVSRAIVDVVGQLGGRTLVLFTALGMMRRCYEQLLGDLELAGVEVLCQGISGTRHILAERFRANPSSVLLGTRSFWEGIDVPGDALQAVLIVKLPFAVPDDPVVAARCERLESQGLNAWTAYSIPQAVILFKQGFGRLMRRATDRGVVLCFDRRLVERNYGRAFLRSVPGYTPVFDSWNEVKERLREWLELPAGG